MFGNGYTQYATDWDPVLERESCPEKSNNMKVWGRYNCGLDFFDLGWRKASTAGTQFLKEPSPEKHLFI